MTPAASVEFWAAPWVCFWIEVVLVGNVSANVNLSVILKSYGRCLDSEIDPYPFHDIFLDPCRDAGLVFSLFLKRRPSPAGY
jgi:hypothetical protein